MIWTWAKLVSTGWWLVIFKITAGRPEQFRIPIKITLHQRYISITYFSLLISDQSNYHLSFFLSHLLILFLLHLQGSFNFDCWEGLMVGTKPSWEPDDRPWGWAMRYCKPPSAIIVSIEACLGMMWLSFRDPKFALSFEIPYPPFPLAITVWSCWLKFIKVWCD